MLELLGLGLAAVAVICLLQLLADRTRLPAAALLTAAGLIYALLPGPNLTLDPHVILTLVIPPLIYLVKIIDRRVAGIRETLTTADANTEATSLLPVVAGGVEAVLAEGLQHHLFLGRVLGKVRS